jgi:hypothetical protein
MKMWYPIPSLVRFLNLILERVNRDHDVSVSLLVMLPRPRRRWVIFRGGIHIIHIVVPREQPHHPHAHKEHDNDNETFNAAGRGSVTFLWIENLHRKGRGEKCESSHSPHTIIHALPARLPGLSQMRLLRTILLNFINKRFRIRFPPQKGLQQTRDDQLRSVPSGLSDTP